MNNQDADNLPELDYDYDKEYDEREEPRPWQDMSDGTWYITNAGGYAIPLEGEE